MSDSQTSFPPPGETSADLWLESSNLVGAVLGGVAYGVHIAVVAECLWHIFPRSFHRTSKNSWFLVAFVLAMFVTGTVNFACNTRMTQLMFVNNRGFDGGPMAWFFANYAMDTNTAGNAGYVIGNFLADALLLWRTYVVWNTIWVIIFPGLVFLGSTAMSFLTLYQASRPDASLWTHTTVQFSLPYFSISISLNILLTLLLVGRLYYMSARAKRAIGREHAATYSSIASMLIESAVPYAIAGLIFIITYARNSNVQNLALPVLGQIMCISPEIIILRVAMGRAVTAKTYQNTPAHTSEMSMKFRSRPTQQDTFQLSTTRGADGTLNNGSMQFSSKYDLAHEDV
ncbi:hypothetical protein L226DRAFT_571168 [Lentinus tigrinus ALCF2SS1-7]|uniref:Uncharacterized protein n=1 Tax=Lentinus tigrinus ALCF2SS1-6 TaxID=1328759 RepID=A0A5C2S8S0_9APHY|nr:hypothetical protein L227DRAFT_109477 [Lentinus tigrinus ALCF2SS1-6]RPD74908.1 hypothetical protein L226DRAFT_571168 [Lentinus tigrinus ALCF2SS1-7]